MMEYVLVRDQSSALLKTIAKFLGSANLPLVLAVLPITNAMVILAMMETRVPSVMPASTANALAEAQKFARLLINVMMLVCAMPRRVIVPTQPRLMAPLAMTETRVLEPIHVKRVSVLAETP